MFRTHIFILNPELSDNWRHMKAVWSVLYSITAAQCVELSLSNVSNWMGDHQRKHCAQLPGEEIGGILVRNFALSSWGPQREKAHGDTIERPKSRASVRIIINI